MFSGLVYPGKGDIMTTEQAVEYIKETGYVQDIGQLDKTVRRDLDKLVRHGEMKKGIFYWPWINSGTCKKTTYYQI